MGKMIKRIGKDNRSLQAFIETLQLNTQVAQEAQRALNAEIQRNHALTELAHSEARVRELKKQLRSLKRELREAQPSKKKRRRPTRK